MEDIEKQIEEYALKTSGLKSDFDRKEEEYYQSEKVYVYDLVKTIIKSDISKAFHAKGMYSEEEVKNAWRQGYNKAVSSINEDRFNEEDNAPTFEEWLRQNKKK